VRQSVRETLRWVRGDTGRLSEHRAVLETFTSYAHCLAEALAAGRPEAEHPTLRVLGEDYLRSALARGRGAIVVTAHAGPWDGLSRMLRERSSVDVVVVMEAERDAAARGLHDGVRRSEGVRIAHVGKDPLLGLELHRHLGHGGIVALQLDRGTPSGRALQVSLFGRNFAVPEGPFRLAAASGAPIVPVFARRTGYFEYEVHLSPEISLERAANTDEIREAAARAGRALEAFVARYPTQWFRFGPPPPAAQMP
jgi:KDO2-lipid IV(A) lauroyltransferase